MFRILGLAHNLDMKYFINNYKILDSTFSHGSYSKIYLAEKENKKYILKEINNKNYNIFKNELLIHKKINHKHAIELKDVIKLDDVNYIITPYYSGGDLFNYLVKRNQLSYHDTKIIAKQLGQVVKYLHDTRISHLDIKPENIFLDGGDKIHIRLGDFGLSKISKIPYKISSTDYITGTYKYSSPEQLNYTYSAYSDIWSYGVTLFTLKSGMRLYDTGLNKLTDDMINKKISNQYFSTDFTDFLNRCIKINPYDRENINSLLNHEWINKN